MSTVEEITKQKLGFSKIQELLTHECLGEAAKILIEKIKFEKTFAPIHQKLNEANEFRSILLSGNAFPSQNYFDLSTELKHLKLEGTRIEQNTLFDLKCSLKTITDCLQYILGGEQVLYPFLAKQAEKVILDKNILKQASKLIDDKGNIPDNASPELAAIRRDIFRISSSIDKRIAKIFGNAKKEGWTPNDAEITIRNGRMVIPLQDTHRRKVKGLIHDESATRQTAYIEPLEIVELNNDLRELEFAEKREIDKLLFQFTEFIRPSIYNLLNAYYFLGNIDFARAKAQLALQIGGFMPFLQKGPTIEWFGAQHPLLYLSLKKQKKQIIPLDIRLNSQKRIMIISGPNAGGKSVCLKTVGLLQYMLQCGLLVPAKDNSEFGIFQKIIIDIGDEQSIENDLSTYSSHLLNMKQLLEEANAETLFLIDEMGSGTEPKAGGAIAEAIVEELDKKQSFGIITTHYANLKLLPDSHPFIANAAMLFDNKNLQPLYKLSIGKPGSSFAFEIATKIGLPETILQKAEEKAGSALLNFENQLQNIETEKLQIQQKQAELSLADEFLSEIIEKYNRLNDNLQEQKKDIIQQAKTEAKEIIGSANKTIENTIAEIKKHQAQKEQTQQARKQLENFVQKLEEPEVENPKEKPIAQKQVEKTITKQKSTLPQKNTKLKTDTIEVGDIVQLLNGNSYAQVIEIRKDKAEVMSNSIKMELPLSSLVKTLKEHIPIEKNKAQSKFFQSVFDSINEKKANFSPRIDLRGKRAEEALTIIKELLDEAILLGEKELILLHGKGNGILRRIIREYLKSQPEIQHFESEHIDRGGDGITIVKLY